MDWPYNAIASGCPRPREDLFKIQPAAAEVVREDKLFPCLVVLYSVFGLLKERQANQENTFSSTVRGYYNMCVSVIFKYEVLQWYDMVWVNIKITSQITVCESREKDTDISKCYQESKSREIKQRHSDLFLYPRLDWSLISKDDFHLKRTHTHYQSQQSLGLYFLK